MKLINLKELSVEVGRCGIPPRQGMITVYVEKWFFWIRVWKFFFSIENPWRAVCKDLYVCAQCGSTEIGEESCGEDESLTVCRDCRAVEQGYRYLSPKEWEECYG